MKIIIFLINLIFLFQVQANEENLFYSHTKNILNCDADWTIVGAGPAGICVIGILLDLGIPANRIIWLDPEFNVGRLSNYANVPANSKNKQLVSFLESCKTFKRCAQYAIDEIIKLNPEAENFLYTIIEPLKEITTCIREKVNSIKSNLKSLFFENNVWKITTENQNFTSYNVVLATGSHPKGLNFPEMKNKEIYLDQALDQNILRQLIKPEDVVAVIGSAHSAILILKYLSEMPVAKIINFYNKPIQYAYEINGVIYNSESGIKGIAANWAKNVLEKNLVKNLVRVESSQEKFKEILPLVTKIIYAIGFERNKLPFIKENPKLEYNEINGIIAPRLYGFGIAFPEKTLDPSGHFEYRVGLNSFIEYAQKIIPVWIQSRSRKNIKNLQKFNTLFDIKIL